MNLSELQNKEVIDIETGTRIGSIIDVIVSMSGNINKLILEDRNSSKRFLSHTKEDKKIDWNQIIKIGDDIILIKENKD